MSNPWKSYVIVSALALTTIGVFIWRKKKRVYVKVGKVSKLFFYPVKSLKAVEISQGKLTKQGVEVNGLLDREFMLVSEDNVLLSQREAPRLQLLTPHISENYLVISGPEVEPLKISLKKSRSPNNKIIECKVHTDAVKGVDVGDEAALWFQSFLSMPGVRMVRFYSDLPNRKYTRKDPFYADVKKKYPIGFQDLAALHMLSEASLEDLNSKIEGEKITVFNFRPSILLRECKPYDEDSWTYIRFSRGAEAVTLLPTTRCLMTTNDPENAVLSQKEPLVTLRKYRIPKDPEVIKKTGSLPCFGTGCAVLKSGEVKIGDDIFAVIGKQLATIKKLG